MYYKPSPKFQPPFLYLTIQNFKLSSRVQLENRRIIFDYTVKASSSNNRIDKINREKCYKFYIFCLYMIYICELEGWHKY